MLLKFLFFCLPLSPDGPRLHEREPALHEEYDDAHDEQEEVVDLLRLLVVGVVGTRFNLQGGVVGAIDWRKRFMSVVLLEKREDGLKCLVY